MRRRTSISTKCAQCGLRVEAGDLVVFLLGDLFHRACWRILVSTKRIGESGQRRRRSRDLIDEARKRTKPK